MSGSGNPVEGDGLSNLRADEYLKATQGCESLKDTYNRCFNSWFHHSFLKGDTSEACDSAFSAFQGCVLERLGQGPNSSLGNMEKDFVGEARGTRATKN